MVLKVVIVEDEKGSREALRALLEEFCDDVKVIASADSVQEAI